MASSEAFLIRLFIALSLAFQLFMIVF